MCVYIKYEVNRKNKQKKKAYRERTDIYYYILNSCCSSFFICKECIKKSINFKGIMSYTFDFFFLVATSSVED